MKLSSKYMSFKIEILIILLLAITHIFQISEEVHAPIHHDTTLDFVIALIQFLFPGVNSGAELVPSPQAYVPNGALRRWLRKYNNFIVYLSHDCLLSNIH